MEQSQTYDALQKLIIDYNLLSNGIQYLENCLNNIHNFAIESCKILVSNDLDTKTRVYIAVFIKNYICDIWNENKILQSQKKVII